MDTAVLTLTENIQAIYKKKLLNETEEHEKRLK